MSVELEIRDGDPTWYLSDDIWVVPGNDPNGPRGEPRAGQKAWVWANVRNNGSDPAADVEVEFRWGNPNAGFDRTTSQYVGTGIISLGPHDERPVRAAEQWMLPMVVTDPHVCLLAQASHPMDTLPPGKEFNVPTEPQRAQRNLHVAPSVMKNFTALVEIHNPTLRELAFAVAVEPGGLQDLGERNLRQLELEELMPRSEGRLARAALIDARTACPTERDFEAGTERSEIRLAGGTVGAVRVLVELDGPSAVFHVTQRVEGVDEPVGGSTYLLLAEPERKGSADS